MRRFLKLTKYDIKMGYIENLIKIIAFICIGLVISIIGMNTINKYVLEQNITTTLGDYICFVVGGPKHLFGGDLTEYIIPVLWLIIQVMIAYISGYYMVKDLHSYGQQILIRSNYRNKWWVSKCVWNIVTITSMYVILYGIIAIVAFLGGAKMTMRLTPDVVMQLCNINMLSGTHSEEMIILLLMPLIVSITISMMQITIAIIVSPIVGFVVSQSIVFLSTIFEYKWLISNYAMLSHNKISCGSKIVYRQGILICIGIYICSWIIGLIYFRRCNILSKNQEM